MGLLYYQPKEKMNNVTAKLAPRGQVILTKLDKKTIDRARKEIYLTAGDIDHLLHEGEIQTSHNIVIKFAGIPRKQAILTEEVM